MDFSTLTAAQKCKYLVLATLYRWRDEDMPALANGEALDELFEHEEDSDDGTFQDARNETRNGTEASDIAVTECSRHYEIDAHVGELPDGTWVGWWHFYGGGKHGEPDAYDWIGNAFDVDHSSEVVTVTKHHFKKREPAPAA